MSNTSTDCFTILFDGDCPFCKLEVNWLQRKDRRGLLKVEDISAPGFDPGVYGRTLDELMGTLHGVKPDGSITTGMETFRLAYRAAGMGWLLAPSGWPLLKPLFDFGYKIFAANRIRMGRLFGRNCASGACKLPVK